jgi:hypothetical protein
MLKLFWKTVSVYYENRMEPTNAPLCQNGEFYLVLTVFCKDTRRWEAMGTRRQVAAVSVFRATTARSDVFSQHWQHCAELHECLLLVWMGSCLGCHCKGQRRPRVSEGCLVMKGRKWQEDGGGFIICSLPRILLRWWHQEWWDGRAM